MALKLRENFPAPEVDESKYHQKKRPSSAKPPGSKHVPQFRKVDPMERHNAMQEWNLRKKYERQLKGLLVGNALQQEEDSKM